ncbi:MAG: tetratricopeptide repeat protein [Caulobacterales bacterium]
MKIVMFALASAAGLLLAGGASASVTVIGDSLAEDCSAAAFHGRFDDESISICTQAIQTSELDRRDLAGTYINRGVMRIRRHDMEAARTDFDIAIKLDANLGEGWVNRGAVNVGEKHYQEGLADINHGLDLGVEEPAKAYYNRALAYEGLDDEKSAYLDYQQAVSLEPKWDLPRKELLRFTVTRR